MKESRSQGRNLKVQRKAGVRASIIFPPDLYETLQEIAKQKNGSLVRDAQRSMSLSRRRLSTSRGKVGGWH
jgi:hypothetical protein